MTYSIRKLNNEELLRKIKSLAEEERKITLEVLHHLQEVYRRRLFATLGYRSLFKYVTRELGFSDGAAQRRISAMILLTEMPEVENEIEKGTITLSNAAMAQRLFQTEAELKKPIDLEKKKEILENLMNKSSREAERELIQHSSQPLAIQKPDQIKSVTPTHSEVRFVADQTLLDQLEEVRGLLANKYPHLTLSELFTEMAKLSLEKLKPKLPQKSEPKSTHKLSEVRSGVGEKVKTNQSATVVVGEPIATADEAPTQAPTRYIPAEVKRTVYYRDEGKCQYVDPTSGRKCGSSHAIHYHTRRKTPGFIPGI